MGERIFTLDKKELNESRDTLEVFNEIISGQRYINMDEEVFIFKDPPISVLTSLKQNQYLDEISCVKEGFFTEEEEAKELKVRGIWDNIKQSKLDNAYEDLKKINASISQLKFKSSSKKQQQMIRSSIENMIESFEKKKRTFFFQTAKYQSELRLQYKILQKSLYKSEDCLYWETWDDFDSETNIKFISDLMVEIFSRRLISEKEIRKVARSEPWRSMWRISTKTGNSLFNKSISEYTSNQKDLCYWSLVYDNVYENPDCPDDSIVEDDDALNSWFENQALKRKSEKKQTSSVSNNSKINNSSEIFVFSETVDDAKEVYNLNAEDAKAKFDHRVKEIKQKGSVKEGELSDVKKDLRIQMNQMASKAIKGK